MRRAGLSTWSGGMICLPNRKRALAVSSIRVFVRNRIGAPLTIIVSPWRSSRINVDMRLFLDAGRRRVRGLRGIDPATVGPPPEYSSLKQAEQGRGSLVRDRERLGAKLLTYLQSLHLGRLSREVGVDHRAKAGVQCIVQARNHGVQQA